MKDSKAVKLIALAYDEGRSRGYNESLEEEQDQYLKGWNLAHEMLRQKNDEALAQAKSQAYEAGYKQGLQSENSYNSGLEAGVKAERERAWAAEPKLSVWFKPCGPSPKPPEAYPLLADKIKAIKAIREAYDQAEGYGLKEVKGLVEVVSYGCRFAAGEPLPQSKAVTLYLALQAAGFDPVLKS